LRLEERLGTNDFDESFAWVSLFITDMEISSQERGDLVCETWKMENGWEVLYCAVLYHIRILEAFTLCSGAGHLTGL